MAIHTKETIKELSIEKLLELLVYCVRVKATQSTKKQLENAEFTREIKQEIIQRAK